MNRLKHGIAPLRTGRKYAENFVERLLFWSTAKPKPSIESRMYVGVMDRITVFQFTLGSEGEFTQSLDQGVVSKLISRAKEVAPTCNPADGDLAVFDGKKILMFRCFDERLTKISANQAAKECACHILMDRSKRRQHQEHENAE